MSEAQQSAVDQGLAGSVQTYGTCLPVPCFLQQCEDLEDTASLHHMFRLMRSMIMLNDTQVRCSWC